MSIIRLQRHGEVDLEFEGELIASSSSEEEGKTRWQVMNLYRITEGPRAGRYVLERLGESRVRGEVTMVYVDSLDTANDVRRRVQRRRDDGTHYLTIIALDLLDQAAKVDAAFLEATAERI